MRRGFTLSETMVATLIAGAVLAAVLSSFLTAQLMMSTAMAESELALAARGIREKLLFHVSPTIDGVHYAGMLSGTNAGWVVEAGSGNVLMSMAAFGNSLADVRHQSMRLLLWQSGTSRFLINEHTPDKDRYAGWLWPGRIPLAAASMSDISSYETVGTAASDVYRVNLDLGFAVKGPRGSTVMRRERVSVPLMGRRQPMKDSAGRY